MSGKQTSTRGRPRGFDRDEALRRAVLLFWEHGYEGTSIGELTRAMGIRPPSLYAAFGDKRSLFEEAVRAYGASPRGRFLADALEQEPTAREAFARILRVAAGQYADRAYPGGCMVICAASNVTAADAEVADFLRGLRQSNVALFEERLQRAVGEGELPAGADAGLLAGYFAMQLQGMSQRARDGAGADELRAAGELAMAAWPVA